MTILKYTAKDANVKLKIYVPTPFGRGDGRPRNNEKRFYIGWAIKGNDFYTDLHEDAKTLPGCMVLFRKAERAIRQNKLTFDLVD